MKLYYFETINPRKACAVAKYLGSPVEFVRVDLGKGEQKAPDYLAINPNGKVPALTDGETKIWEANAIMAYLARLTDSDLWPRDDDRQIEVTRWLSWSADHATRERCTSSTSSSRSSSGPSRTPRQSRKRQASSSSSRRY
jgi:glutathione S-transferase